MATDSPAIDPAEVETPKSVIPVAPVVEGGVEVYNSSEEFQMAHQRGLAQQKAEEAKQKATTEKQKIGAVLDEYIGKYSKTTEVRKMAEKHKKTAEHYLDVAADVVEILEKIKNQLR